MDISIFISTFFITYIFSLFVNQIVRNTEQNYKLKLKIVIWMVYFYSGFGIAIIKDGWLYLYKYSVFLFLLIATILLWNVIKIRNNSGLIDRVYLKFRILVKILFLVHISTIVFALIYPEFRILDLLNPVSVFLEGDKGQEVFLSRISRASNPFLTINGYFRLLTTPFFYIHLYEKYKDDYKRLFKIMLAITYADIVIKGQWGRVTLIIPFVFLLIHLNKLNKLKKRSVLSLLLVGVFLVMPLMTNIADWRRGIYSTEKPGITEFVDSEFTYPILYDLCLSINEGSNNYKKYLTWLITLPIPSSVYNADYVVTKILSERALGVQYGMPGFYVLLPSWLGESFIVFGKNYYWVGAILTGSIIGLMNRIIARNKVMFLYDIFFTTLLFSYLRSVSQEFIAQLLQSMWLLLILVFLALCSGRHYSKQIE